MLIEADPGLATLLWQMVHAVRMWSAQPPAARAGLFAPLSLDRRRLIAAAVAEYPVLRWPLRTVEVMVSCPEHARPREVALACAKITEWADALHMSESALQFSEAGALADPRNAKLAAVAGSACARLADSARAEAWYRRAIKVGRRNEDWEWYIRAYIRFANLVYELGDFGRAHDYYLKALRAARWRGRPPFAGQAAHGMFQVAIHVSGYRQAEDLGLLALSAYPVNHERVPHLAHDIAYLLLRHGWYSRATRILDAVVPMIVRPNERIVVMGSVARAAAGMKRRDQFEQAAAEVELLAEISTEGAGMAFVHVAEGFLTFGQWDAAERLAARALEVAMRRGERDTQRHAYATLDRITHRTPAATEPPVAAGRVDATVATVLTRLETLSAPRQRPGAPAVATAELPVLSTPA